MFRQTIFGIRHLLRSERFKTLFRESWAMSWPLILVMLFEFLVSITDVWVVEKPTTDGVVTSVEAFDGTGEVMAMFFGVRKPGVPELQAWRDLVRELPRRDAATALA